MVIFGGFWVFCGVLRFLCFFVRGFLFLFLGDLRVFVVLGAFVDLGALVTVWLFACLRACVRFL